MFRERLLVDDLNPTGLPQIIEEVVNGVATHVYVYGSRLITERQSAATGWLARYYGYDAHGNVTFLTDENGAVTDTRAYDAYGTLLYSTGTTPDVYLYQGQRWDADLELYYMRARWYEPKRGRFLTRDPVRGRPADPITFQRYSFAGLDPVNLKDPSGKTAIAEYVTIGAVLLAAATPATANIGFDGGYTTVRTIVAGYLGLHATCALWTGADALATALLAELDQEATTALPPWPFQHCQVARQCPPCPPPPPPRLDRVPPSEPHYPCPGDHVHTFVMNQNPKTCQCFVNKGPIICR